MGLACAKLHRFVEYTLRKCFNSFVRSAVDAGRRKNENNNSSVVAETMKLLANGSYGQQKMDRSQQTLQNYLSDEQTHVANSSKLLRKVNHVKIAKFEVELAQTEMEHRDPIVVEFFTLQ